MVNYMTNKFLSIILAVSLLVGLIPTLCASASDSDAVLLEAEPVFVQQEFGTIGTPVTALVNGDVSVSYTIKSTHTEDKEAFMFAVLRTGGKLKGMQFEKLSLSPLATNTFNVAFHIDDYENQSIEIYVWDSLSGKTALTSSYTISADGITTTAAE